MAYEIMSRLEGITGKFRTLRSARYSDSVARSIEDGIAELVSSMGHQFEGSEGGVSCVTVIRKLVK